MTFPCPAGHESTTGDWCDQCGARIGAPPGVVEEPEPDTARSPAREPCPSCGAPRSGDDGYCERCGYDLIDGRPVPVWEVVVAADRARFDRSPGNEFEFPVGYGEWRVALDGERVTIGRGRAGSSPPEIELAGAHADPGVSRAHAMLERQPDGGYAVVDLDSTNGTTVNDDATPIESRVRVALSDGDRVHVGAWTTITLRHR